MFLDADLPRIVPMGYTLVDVSNKGRDIFKSLSSQHPHSVYCYAGKRATCVSNAMEFSQVSKKYDDGGKPSQEWYSWRDKGFTSRKALYYINGKKVLPEYFWWNDARYGVYEFRKRIYFKLYESSIKDLPAFHLLQKLYNGGDKLCIRGNDVYDGDYSYEDVLRKTDRHFGVGFFLYKILSGDDA